MERRLDFVLIGVLIECFAVTHAQVKVNYAYNLYGLYVLNDYTCHEICIRKYISLKI